MGLRHPACICVYESYVYLSEKWKTPLAKVPEKFGRRLLQKCQRNLEDASRKSAVPWHRLRSIYSIRILYVYVYFICIHICKYVRTYIHMYMFMYTYMYTWQRNLEHASQKCVAVASSPMQSLLHARSRPVLSWCASNKSSTTKLSASSL